MSLVAKEGAKAIPPLEAGVYTAVCVGVVDLGEQRNERFKKYQERVLFFFEIVGEFVDVGEGELKPRWLSKEFTMSLNSRSNLTKTLQAWRNQAFTPQEVKGFDLSQMAGEACQVQVMLEEKDGKAYNYIQGLMGVPKGMKLEPPISELIVFDMDDPKAEEDVFPKLPEWVQEKVKKSTQWVRKHQNTEMLDLEDEEEETGMEIPF